jgi:asparagine synthase (glutamine-hydrolysing)
VQSEGHHRELVTILERMAAAMDYDEAYSRELVCRPTLGAFVGRVGFPVSASRGAGVRPSKVAMVTTDDAEDDLNPNGTPSSGGSAGFVADEDRKECVLFNDRYGMHRIFLHSDASRTFFSSEAKAILAVAPATRAFDPVGLGELLASGCTLGEHSLFRGIEVLDAGTLVTFRYGTAASRRRYFVASELEGTPPVSERAFLDGFAHSLQSAVTAAVAQAPAVGISLTGGLDSRMIMASLEAPAGSIPCYTFGSMYRTTFDVSVGRRVAASCGHPHQVIELGRGFLAGLSKTLDESVYVSDGYMGLSGAAELYLNRMVRSIAPARMTGNWGGELMRGVRAFKFHPPKGPFVRPDLVQQMNDSAEAFANATHADPLSFALFHQMPFQGYGRHAIERSQVVMRAPFLARDVVDWLYRAPASVRGSAECVAAVIGRRPELLAIPTDAGRLGNGLAAVRLLRRAYRRALVKGEYLTSHGAPDWLAALSASVPRSLIETRFLGLDKFQHFRLWIRNELSGFVRDIVMNERNSDLDQWFDMRKAATMVDDHVAGRANYTDEIDKVLTVAAARRTLFGRFDQGRRQCA